MSSPLPKSLRQAVKDTARATDRRVRCAMCGGLFEDDEIEVDHIIPEADGGSHDPSNLQPLCAPKVGKGCHRLKSIEENKARKKAKAAAEERAKAPASLMVSAFALGGALVSGWSTWLMYQEKPVVPFLWDVHRWLGLGLLAVALLALLRALALAPGAVVPTLEDFLDGEDEGETKPPKTRPGRMVEALKPVIGEVKAVERDGGIEVRYGKDVADHEDATRLKVLQRVNAKMGGRWEPLWDSENNRVIFHPRPAFASMIRHPGLTAGRPWYLIPIADNVTIDLRQTSHVLIIGVTNMGKTGVIRSIVVAVGDSAKREQASAVLMDPKRVELIGFRNWPGVRGVMTDDERLWQTPLDLLAEMDRRYTAFERDNVSLDSHTPWVVVLDEFEQYVVRMQAMWQSIDPETKKPRKKTGEKIPPPVQAIQTLLAMARRCGIHLIIGTQRPDASWFGGAARDNLQCRIGVGPLSRAAAMMLFERADVGRDLPPHAKGRITFQSLDGDHVEAQSWWVPDPGNADGKNTVEDEQHLGALRR